MDNLPRIRKIPGVCGGRVAVFEGTRIPAVKVALRALEGQSLEELRVDFPRLQPGDRELALQYLAENPDEKEWWK